MSRVNCNGNSGGQIATTTNLLRKALYYEDSGALWALMKNLFIALDFRTHDSTRESLTRCAKKYALLLLQAA